MTTVCATHQMPFCRLCNRQEKAPFGTVRSELRKSSPTRSIPPDPNPSGLCMCGCGGQTSIVERTNRSVPVYAGHHRKFLKGHQILPKHTGQDSTCEHCGKGFKTRSANEVRRFCSRKCWRDAGPHLSPEQYESIGQKNSQRRGRLASNFKHGESRTDRNNERFQSGQAECQHPDCPGTTFLFHQHHVVYKQHVKRAGGDLWDPANALNLCASCHASHHHGNSQVPLTALRDQNIIFAFSLLGAAAYDYLRRYYTGEDQRIARALLEYEAAA